MATAEEVNLVEQKVLEAHDALLAYVNRPDSLAPDIELHVRLAEEVQKANAEYIRLLSEVRGSIKRQLA
jgi:hypothetical protein